MTVIPTLFRKLQTVKNLVLPLSKKHCFRTPFDSQPVKVCQTLAKCSWDQLHLVFFITLRKPDFQNIFLSDMLTLRVAWYHIDYQWEVSCSRIWQFVDSVQMQLSWKLRFFSRFSAPFLETTLNFENLEKKMIFIPTIFRKLQTAKVLVIRPLSKKRRFRTPFDSQYVKGSKNLVKSSWEHFLYILHHFERTWFGIYFP